MSNAAVAVTFRPWSAPIKGGRGRGGGREKALLSVRRQRSCESVPLCPLVMRDARAHAQVHTHVHSHTRARERTRTHTLRHLRYIS